MLAARLCFVSVGTAQSGRKESSGPAVGFLFLPEGGNYTKRNIQLLTKWQLKLPGNGGGAATLFTYISCTFRHFPCEIGRCFFGINKHDRHLARSRKDRSERGPHHAKGTRYVGELFGRPVGSISCHSVC